MVDRRASALEITFEGMGKKNSDADHTKQRCNGLGHRNPSFETPQQRNGRTGRTVKRIPCADTASPITEDSRQHRMSERRRAAGKTAVGVATSRRERGLVSGVVNREACPAAPAKRIRNAECLARSAMVFSVNGGCRDNRASALRDGIAFKYTRLQWQTPQFYQDHSCDLPGRTAPKMAHGATARCRRDAGDVVGQ